MNGEVVNRQLSNQLEYYSADKGYYDTGHKSSSVKARALGNRPPGYDRPFFTNRYENELERQGHRIKRRKDKSPSHPNAGKGELSIISSQSEEDLHHRDEPSNKASVKTVSSCNAVRESKLNHTDIPDSKQKPRPRPRHSRDRQSDKHREHKKHVDSQDKSRERNPQYLFDQNGFIDGYNGLSDRKQSSKSDRGRENSRTRASSSKRGSRNSRNDSTLYRSKSSDGQGSSTSHNKRKGQVSDVHGSYCELVPLEKKISVDSYRGGSVRDNSDCHSIASEPSNARHTSERGKRTGNRTSKKSLPNRTPKQSRTCCGIHSKQKRRCLVCLSILMVFITLCIVTAGVLVYIRMRDADKSTSLYDMVKAHVRLRIVNKEYSPALVDPESGEHSSFASTFCKEVDIVYLTSALDTDYFGCSLRTTRAGSIHVYYVAPFLDSPYSSNVSVHEEILSNGQPRTSGTGKDVSTSDVNKKTVTYGDLIVEVKSIDIFLEKYKTDRLPSRPVLHSLPTADNGIEEVPSSTTTEQPPSNSTVPSSNPTVTTTRTTVTTPQEGNEEAAMKTKVKVIVDATAVPTNDAVTSIHLTSPSSLDNIDLFGIDDITTDINYTYTATAVPLTSHNFRDKIFQTTVPVKIKRATVWVIGDDVSLGKSATIRCQVFTEDEIGALTFKRTNENGQASPMASFTGDQLKSLVTGKPHSRDGGKVTVFKMEGTVVVRLNFSSVGCKDTGDFRCSVQLTDGTNVTGQGGLIARGPPGQPVLSVPQPLVENRELITPITCTGNVGFPPGRLGWLIKPRGSTEFFPFDGNIVSTSGTCDNYVTNSLIYTPTRDGNGTLLKCVVVNKHVPMVTELSAVTELQILSEHLCEGVSKSRTIRHPFTCTKYIRCRGNKDFVVHDCENQMCFDEKSGKCGQIALTMPTVNAILNDGVALLKCRLIHNGAWNTITISRLSTSGVPLRTSGDKMTSSGDRLSVASNRLSTSGDKMATYGKKTKILTATSGVRSATVHESAMSGRVHTFLDESKLYQVEVSLWVELTCEDEGSYVCEVNAPFYVPGAVGNITIEAQPGAPTLTIPNEIVENLPMRQNISCEADVGYPHGTLVLKIKRPGDPDYITVSNQTTTEETRNCSQIVTTSFSYVPSLEHNGMLVRCELENNVTLPFDHKYVAEENIHVLPGNFCQLAGERSIQEHPYDCHQYVSCLDGYIYVQRCGSSHCFDPRTLRCDRAVKTETEFDPRHPCLPDKTGVFFRHPVLCNKFYWCVQGRAVVRHCPLGTLYLDGGQCTFEPDRSLCYKAMTKQ